MTASLRALLAGVIDYAGLFPPAQLPLEEAVRNYARYRTEPESWMLGRFVCPAARLAELEPLEELFQEGPPFAFSVLGRGGNTTSEFLQGLGQDVRTLKRFLKRHEARVALDSIEVRLPACPATGESLDLLGKAKAFVTSVHERSVDDLSLQLKAKDFTTAYIDVLQGEAELDLSALLVLACYQIKALLGRTISLSSKKPEADSITPFFELNSSQDWRPSLAFAIEGLTKCSGFGPSGFKLRCGGTQASAFPPPEQVAHAISVCRDALVAMKFTAGLHHPIRHFNAGVQTHMHGFLNVFGAGVLAHVRRLAEEQVLQVVEDEDPGHFVFDDEGFRWKDWRATVNEIAWARQLGVTSFGSCSFDEPREDLRALGLLP